MMEREPDSSDRADDRELFRRLTDGLISAEEFNALEERLLGDAEFRARYIRQMDLEASLYELVGAAVQPVAIGSSASRPPVRRRRMALVACALVALLIGGIVLNRHSGNAPPQDGAPEQRIARPSTDAVENSSVAHYRERQLPGLSEVVIVTRIQDIGPVSGSTALRAGRRLKPGRLFLPAGRVHLEFLSGAEVVVEGPADLSIESAIAVTLEAGRAAARVRPSARGFLLNAPGAAIVDLGTAFAVSVDRQGRSEVHVTEGQVEVSLLGDDGNTLVSERLEESQTVRIRQSPSTLESVEQPSAGLPTLNTRPRVPLPVTAEYVQQIVNAAPVIYWRFESVVDGRTPNEMGAGWSGRLHEPAAELAAPAVPGEVAAAPAPSISIAGGALHMTEADGLRHFESDGPVPALNGDAYSIELWANPDRLQWATLVGIMPEREVWAPYHLNVIELAHQTSFVHTPGTFRFMHRHPPKMTGGVNLFAPEGCSPGQWHHIVATRTPNELTLYVNGQPVRRLEMQSNSDENSYRVLLGQLHDATRLRQFVGMLDEFALYRRALTDAEVGRHYELLAKQQPD